MRQIYFILYFISDEYLATYLYRYGERAISRYHSFIAVHRLIRHSSAFWKTMLEHCGQVKQVKENIQQDIPS